MKVDVTSPTGTKAGSAELPDGLFGITPNVAVLHQVVRAQLGHRRAGTHSTKTRAEVSGGGAKPWRQKGTGRARHGSIRSPQWRGGGIAHGPKPRDYSEHTPKKMVRLALRSALSDRAADRKVVVVGEWGWNAPSTKAGKAALAALGIDGRALVVVGPDEDNVILSFRNLPEVHLVEVGELNAYDVLCSDWIVFSKATLPEPSTAVGAKVATATPVASTKPGASAKAAAAEEPDAEESDAEEPDADVPDADESEEAK